MLKSSQYIAFVKDELWGVMDENFEVMIEPKYQFLSANGYHPKSLFQVIQENEFDGLLEFYYINTKDEKISDAIEVRKDDKYLHPSSSSENKEEMLFSISMDGTSTFYNYDGDIAFDKIFDYEVNNWLFEKEFKRLTNFIYEQLNTNDMVIVAKKDGKVGMLDMNLNTIIPFIYDNLGLLTGKKKIHFIPIIGF